MNPHSSNFSAISNFHYVNQANIIILACNLVGTVEQTGGYNFSIKGKNKIPACQTRFTTLHLDLVLPHRLPDMLKILAGIQRINIYCFLMFEFDNFF